MMILITSLTEIAWTLTEYFAEVERLKTSFQLAPSFVFDPYAHLKFAIGTLAIYTERTRIAVTQKIYLSEGTVKNYVTQFLNTLEMRDRIQAVLRAQQNLL